MKEKTVTIIEEVGRVMVEIVKSILRVVRGKQE